MVRERKNSQDEPEVQDEQGDVDPQETLFDLETPGGKRIAAVARRYKRIVTERQSLTEQECKLKNAIIEMSKDAGIVANPDGTFRFRCNGCVISIKPRDPLVQIKDENARDDQ